MTTDSSSSVERLKPHYEIEMAADDFRAPEMPDDFMPEFQTKLDEITNNELRMAIWHDPVRRARTGLGYVLSMPDDNRAGRIQQAERDEALRKSVWIVAMAARVKDTDPKAKELLGLWGIDEVDGWEIK